MAENRLVGMWRLLSARFWDADGASVDLFGESPEGRIVYDAHGNMTVHLMRLGRPAFGLDELADAAPDLMRAALLGFNAYFGTYTVDEAAGVVTHHLAGALYPDWVGTDQLRRYAFDGNRLILRTGARPLTGRIATGEVVWEKMA